MGTKEAQKTDILSCKEIPVIRAKYYEKDAFIMGFYVYKAAGILSIREMLSCVMESSNIMDKYAVDVQDKDKKVEGHLPLGKSRKLAKTIFYFLKADKNHF